MKNDICIYRHLKPNGEVFYIGIGSLKRAYTFKDRNKYWHHVVDKYDYEIQILKTGLSKEEACELESILISYYGRKDIGTGRLVNMTNGGEGAFGVLISEDRKKKVGEFHLGRKRPLETGQKISKALKNIPKSKEHKAKLKSNHADFSGGKHPRARKVINTETGQIFGSISEAAKEFNLKERTLHSYLNKENPNKTKLEYYEVI